MRRAQQPEVCLLHRVLDVVCRQAAPQVGRKAPRRPLVEGAELGLVERERRRPFSHAEARWQHGGRNDAHGRSLASGRRRLP